MYSDFVNWLHQKYLINICHKQSHLISKTYLCTYENEFECGNIEFMLVLFGSFFNCLQGLVIWQIKIFTLQKFIRLNPTFLKNATSSLVKLKTNIRSLPVKKLSNSATLYLYKCLLFINSVCLLIVCLLFVCLIFIAEW